MHFKKNFMFRALDPKDTDAVIDAIQPMKKEKGEIVIQQDDEGDFFYIIDDGTPYTQAFLNPFKNKTKKNWHRGQCHATDPRQAQTGQGMRGTGTR